MEVSAMKIVAMSAVAASAVVLLTACIDYRADMQSAAVTDPPAAVVASGTVRPGGWISEESQTGGGGDTLESGNLGNPAGGKFSF